MKDQLLYEYAVIRLVPRVEREEFVNIGVVVYCAAKKYLNVRYTEDVERWQLLSQNVNVADVICYLQSFERICKGGDSAGPIGCLGAAERFRWLTATRSTIIQTSKVHPGFCVEPDARLNDLYEQLVAVAR